jgi:hypothetical protein
VHEADGSIVQCIVSSGALRNESYISRV